MGVLAVVVVSMAVEVLLLCVATGNFGAARAAS